MDNQQSLTPNYPDGLYTLTNPHGVKTLVKVNRGLVYIVNGFCDGSTGQTIDKFISDGFKAVKSWRA